MSRTPLGGFQRKVEHPTSKMLSHGIQAMVLISHPVNPNRNLNAKKGTLMNG